VIPEVPIPDPRGTPDTPLGKFFWRGHLILPFSQKVGEIFFGGNFRKKINPKKLGERERAPSIDRW
jgi:hypothetical protein